MIDFIMRMLGFIWVSFCIYLLFTGLYSWMQESKK